MTVLEYSHADGLCICEARRFTEEEKAGYMEWFRELGLVAIGPSIDLKYLSWQDPMVNEILMRQEDGEFLGCSNTARIISEDEKAKLIAANEEKRIQKKRQAFQERIDYYQSVVSACEKQGKLFTKEEALAKAKAYNDLYNEGGEGFVPHFWTVDEYESAKTKLAQLTKKLLEEEI